MGEVSFLDVSKRFYAARGRRGASCAGARPGQLHGQGRRDRRADRPFRLRQDHRASGRDGARSVERGRVTVDGREINGCGHDRGMVFQHAELLPWLSALQNVMFGLEMKGIRGTQLRETAEKYLHLVGLKDSQSRRPHQFSGGMKQRVGIARALAIDPKVLLMDEPFGALDAQTRETLQAELLDIHGRTGKTILFVTHDLDEAVIIADRIVVMKDGRVQEIMNVPLKRPRPDLGLVRGMPEFAETRYKVWRAAARRGHGALMVDIADRQEKATAKEETAERKPIAALADHGRVSRGTADRLGDIRPPHQSGIRLLSVRDCRGILGACRHRPAVVGAL